MVALTNGPLNKSLYTQELELIAKTILYAPSQVYFSIKYNADLIKSFYVKIANIEINLSALYKKANFDHIALNDNDSARFVEKYNVKILPCEYNNRVRDVNNTQQDRIFEVQKRPCENDINEIKKLSDAELHAIYDWSGIAYQSINSVAYDHVEDFSTQNFASLDLNLKDTVLKTVMLASGLNKISPETGDTVIYRGEHALSTEEIQHRIHLVEQGGGITEVAGFMSASVTEHIAKSFSFSTLINFDTHHGKNITMISDHKNEKEYLMPPSSIWWDSYEFNNDTRKHIFHAKVVAPLIQGKDNPTQCDILKFKHLLDWSELNGMNTDFLTTHNAKLLKNANFINEIKLEDCISESTEIPGLSDSETQYVKTSIDPVIIDDHQRIHMVHMVEPVIILESPDIIAL